MERRHGAGRYARKEENMRITVTRVIELAGSTEAAR